VQVEVGSMLAGAAALITALVTAFVALARARQASAQASEAMRTSPAAEYEGLRQHVNNIMEAYESAVERHADERGGMEASLERERTRADKAERQVIKLMGQLTTMRIDFNETRREVDELRARFEASLPHP
jgi:tRNA C32,U32 (ribose-2'-O)-methylase TrmJ